MVSLALRPAAVEAARRAGGSFIPGLVGGVVASEVLSDDQVVVNEGSRSKGGGRFSRRSQPLPQSQLRDAFRANLTALSTTKVGRRFVRDAAKQQGVENLLEFFRLYIGLVASSPMLALVNAWLLLNGLQTVGALSSAEATAIKVVIGTKEGLAAAGPLGALALGGVAASTIAGGSLGGGGLLRKIWNFDPLPGVAFPGV